MNSDTPSRSRLAGQLAVGHAAVLVAFLTWRYGGMETLARNVAGWALLPAPLLTVYAWLHARSDLRRRFLWIAVPLGLLCLQVGVSMANPSMQQVNLWGEHFLRPVPHRTWLPANPFPSVTGYDFALNLGLVLVGLNLLLTRPSRRLLRGLVAGIALNTVVLAVVGTFFKLTNSTEILGLTPSANPNFFSTFVYHNHWGAVALLGAGASAGIALYHNRRRQEGFFLSPAPFWVLCTGLIMLAIPLSSSRSATGAALALCAGIALSFLSGDGVNRRRRAAALALVAAAGIVIVGLLAQRTLRNEYHETTRALREMNAGGIGEGRVIIYGDTLRLIGQQPWFGWGWGSFQYVYPQVASPRPFRQTYQYEQYVLDAHSDWLQFPAEIGIVGCSLLLVTLAGWLHWGGFRRWRHAPSREIAFALGSLALLALVDFPAACPAVVATAACLLSCGSELARVSDGGDEPRKSLT